MSALLFFKLLADQTRFHTLMLIQGEQELCVCELICALELSQPKVSRHLAQLREAGIVSGRKSGKWVYYSINKDLPQWQQILLQQTYQHIKVELQPLIAKLEQMGERPSRQNQCC